MGLRHLQVFLGHANLNTVAVYTQVGIKALKDLHQAMHPAASLQRSRRTAANGGDDPAPKDLLEALEDEGQQEAEAQSWPVGRSSV